jgi:peptide/nickel transport system substrate-binding protein
MLGQTAIRSATLWAMFLCSFAIGFLPPQAALAQKQGGTLRVYHWDVPASASIHEEATLSTLMPFMGLFNNLVLFDLFSPINRLDTIQPDIAKSWAWNADKTKLTFQLHAGVKWHDGQPFTAKDVVCTFHRLAGLPIGGAKTADGDELRKNPRKIWWFNLDEVTTNGEHEVTFNLKQPQPSFLALLASGYTPLYSCHVPQSVMRTKPIGTGPFKFGDMKRSEFIKIVRNPDYFRPGKPYLDAIDFRIIENRSTRILAFAAGDFDLTFDIDVTVPLVKEVRRQAPRATCVLRATGGNANLIVNPSAPPFDNVSVRRAMALAIDREAFNDILSEGKATLGGAMLPAPEGVWSMPPDMLAGMPGYEPDMAKRIAEAQGVMQAAGYGPGKPLKIKISTRNIPIFRDPAVILIDQLKKIYIEGQLDVVDTSQWFPKIVRKDFTVGMNNTGLGVDDPDVNLVENYMCKSERNYTQYCNADVDQLIMAQSRELDFRKRRSLVWEIERKLIEDVARPIIFHGKAATCWHPHVKGVAVHHNSIYNNWRFEEAWLDR